MDDIEFAAFLVSRVCHDLVGPLGAVVNGLEVMEDERDAAMRADALKIVSSSALQALARLQFLRIAFGAAGSAGAELDIGEVGRLVGGPARGRQDPARLAVAACELAQELGQTADERRACWAPIACRAAASSTVRRQRRSGRALLQDRRHQPARARYWTRSQTAVRGEAAMAISTRAASSPI